MPRLKADLFARNYVGAYSQYQRLTALKIEAAALIATERAAHIGLETIRGKMHSARLGKLGRGLAATSDAQRTGKVHRTATGFSASGMVFIRSRSARTRGAIESYAQGATIAPVRGRWLWIATDEIPRVTGRYRMTPELYRKNGFEKKIGPLVLIRSINGFPLLAVKGASVAASGAPRKAKALTKTGKLKKGQMAREFLVAFIGIPRTSRAARIDVHTIMRQVQADLPRLFTEALGRI